MTLSPRVGGATSKPVDVSPSPAAQRFASNSCVTTKMTYEFFNELIENFTLAQVAYDVTNVPNDPNALKKLLDSVRTGSYNFTTGTINTSNNDIVLGTGKLYFTANDFINFDDTSNMFELVADGASGNGKIKVGQVHFSNDDYIDYNDSTNEFTFLSDGVVGSSIVTCGTIRIPNQVITSPESINVILDDNNNQTGQSFNIYNHDTTNVNLRATITEAGDLSLFNPNGSNMLKLVDGASTATLANPFLSWNYTATDLSGIVRLGYIGYDSTFNTHLKISNEATGGDIILSPASGLIETNNNNIRLGSGSISFASYGTDTFEFNDTTNQFVFTADGSIGNSILRSGNLNLGDENLSLYRENVTFTATFYNGTTQITGSSGTSNVSSYDARFSRVGNIVTVNISNIVLDVAGDCGTTLGSYPALTTTGEFSIRGLPYNALKDSCGSYIGFYNGSDNSNSGAVYIIAGTNNIRFSTTGFGASFGIRGVTITYMV